MLLVSTTRIIPGRAVPSFLSGRYPAVKVRKKLYVTDEKALVCDDACNGHYCIIASETGMADHDIVDTYRGLWRIAMTSAT